MGALITKSQVYSKLERNEEALQCLGQVLSREPNSTEALASKAQILAASNRLKDIEEAVQMCDKVI
jgi:tetratricopeptide (TPR) repeat protein